jgi:hypothetical protein
MLNKNWTDRQHHAVRDVAYHSKCDVDDVSELGVRVAIILHFWQGIHNINHKAKKKADWTGQFIIDIQYGFRGLASFDSEDLMRLMVISGLAMARVEISPFGKRKLMISFSLRKTREGNWQEMLPHPLEQVKRIIKNGHSLRKGAYGAPYDDEVDNDNS